MSSVLPASSLPEGKHEVVPHSDEGGGALLGLAQRVPLRETREIRLTRVRWDAPGMGVGSMEMLGGFKNGSDLSTRCLGSVTD
jgi:hypothetical protein